MENGLPTDEVDKRKGALMQYEKCLCPWEPLIFLAKQCSFFYFYLPIKLPA